MCDLWVSRTDENIPPVTYSCFCPLFLSRHPVFFLFSASFYSFISLEMCLPPCEDETDDVKYSHVINLSKNPER